MPPLDPFDQVTLARFDAPDTTTPADSTPDEGTDPFRPAMPKPRMAPRPKRESAVDRLEAAGVGGKADPFSPAASRALMQDAARRDRQSAQASYDANAQIRAAAETQAAQQKQAKADAEAARKQANANREAYFKTNGIKHYTDAFGDIVPETHDDGAFRYQTSENGKAVIHRGTDAIGGDYRIERDDRGRTTTHDENQYRTFADDPGVVYRGGRDAKAKSTGAGAFDKTGWQKIASVDEALASDHEPLRAAGEAAAKERNQRLTNIGLEALKTREMAADVKLDAWKQKFGAERTEAESLDTEIARLSSHQGEKAGGFLGIGGDLTPAAVEAQKKLGQLQARRDQIGERPKDLGQAMDADPEAMAAREEGNVARREAADFARLVELHNGDVTAATRQWRAVLGDRAKDHPALVAMDQARQAWGMPSDQQFDEAKRAKQIEFLKQHTDPAVQALGGKLEALDARQKAGPGEKADFETRKAWAENLQKEYAAVEDQRAALQKREEEAAAAMQREKTMEKVGEARKLMTARQAMEFDEAAVPTGSLRDIPRALKRTFTGQPMADSQITEEAEKRFWATPEAKALTESVKARWAPTEPGAKEQSAEVMKAAQAKRAEIRQQVQQEWHDSIGQRAGMAPEELTKWKDHARILNGEDGGFGVSPATGKFLVSDKVWKSPAWTQRMIREADEGLIPGVQTDEQKKAFRDLVAAKQAADQQQLIDTAKKFPDWAQAQAAAGDGATDQEVYDRWKAKGSAAKTAAAFFRNTAAGAVGLIESGINGAELWVRDKADAVGQWMGADFLKSSPDDFAKVLADFASPEGSMSAAIRNKDPRAEGFWSGTGDVIGSQLPGWLAAFALSRVPGLKNAATKATAINSTLTTLTYGLSEFASNYEQVYNSLLPKTPDGQVDQAAVTPEIQKTAHEAAMKTFNASMLGGASELLPLEKVFKAIPVGKMPRLVKVLKEAASETTQEAFQNELDAIVQGEASGGAASPERLTDPGKWKEYAQMAGGMAMPIAAGIIMKARQAHRWLAKNGKEADQMVQSIGSLDTAWKDYQGTASPDVVALGGIDPRGQTGRQMERAAALVKQYQTGTKPGEGTTVENKVEALQELQALHNEIDGGFTGLARKLETAQKLAPVAQQIADFGPEQLATMLEAKGIAPESAAQYVQNPDYVERQRTILSATVKAAMGNRDLMTQAEEQALGEMISPTGEASASPVERVYDFEGQPIVEERTRRTLLKFLPATAALFPDTEEQRKIAIRQAKEKAEADKIEAEKAKAAGKEPAKPAKGGASAGAEIPANATPEAPQSTVTGSTANTANATPSPLQSPASGTMLSENESAAVRDLSQHLTSMGLPEDEARTVATGHVVASPEGTYAQYETVGGKGAMTFLRARGKLHDDMHSQGWRFENDQAIRPAPGVTSAKQGMPGTPEAEVRQHVDAAVAKMDPVFQARIKFVGPKEGGIDQTGGMHATSGGDIMVSTEVLGQDLARMPADKRAARVEALLDEEVRHQVQFAQARRAFAQHKKKGETFDDFLNRYYGDIWREEFATKPKLVEALRQLRTAATFDKQPDWAKLFEAVRLLWQMKARGEASESFVALVQGIGAKTARYIKGILDFLRDLATGKKAGKWVQAEIAALETILAENAKSIKARREIESLNNENHVLDPTHDQLPGLAPQGDSAGDRQPRPQGSVPTQGASPQGGATHAPKAPGKVGGRGQNGTNPGGTGATRGGDGAGAAPVGNRGSAQSGQGVQGNGVGGRTESVQGAGRRGAAVLSQLEDQRDALALEIRAMWWATQPNAKAAPEAWKKWERIKSGMEAELRDLDDRIEGLAAAAESEIRDQLAPETSDQRPIDEAAHDAATSPKNDLPQPTDAQKEAGNYPMGHVTVGGLQVSIENPIGSTRSGTDSDGEKWSIQMKAHYGYIRGTEGKDGDHVDVFLNKGIPDGFAGPAFIVDQVNPKTGKFDEHKVVLGVKTLNDAKRLYLSHYTQGWKGLGAITEMPWDEFKVWALAGERTKPVGKLTTTVSDSPEPAKKPGRKQKLREELEAAIRENERKGAKGKPKAQQAAAAPRTPEEQAVEDAIAEAIRAGGQTLASAPLAGLPLVEPGFYSQLQAVIAEKMPPTATVEQVRGIIANPQTRIKADEIKWSGILTWLAAQGSKVSRDDVLAHLRGEGEIRFVEADLSKYANYQLPGGENYREIVVGIPIRRDLKRLRDLENKKRTPAEDAELESLVYKESRNPKPDRFYVSGHYKEVRDYLAHMRVNERPDATGRPGLFLEELQSDRHQQGRERGYESEWVPDRTGWNIKPITLGTDETFFAIIQPDGSQYVPVYNTVEAAQRNLDWEIRRRAVVSGNAPILDAPYRKDWPLMLFKRALRDAIASGKQWIGWTTGQTQADRYDLSEQLSRISYEPNEDGSYEFEAYSIEDDLKPVISESEIDLKRIEELAGKEIAQKVEARQGEKDADGYRDWHHLRGLDLKVGGEGMKGFYDTILPKEIGRYVKQWGATVAPSEVPNESGTPPTQDRYTGRWFNTQDGPNFATKEEALAAMSQTIPIWRVEITPQMRESIQRQGQTLFSAPLAGAVEAPNAALLAALTKVGQAVHAAGHTTPAAFAERIIRGAWGQGATVGVRTVATAWTWTPSADFAKVPNWSKIVPAIEARLRKQGLAPAPPKNSEGEPMPEPAPASDPTAPQTGSSAESAIAESLPAEKPTVKPEKPLERIPQDIDAAIEHNVYSYLGENFTDPEIVAIASGWPEGAAEIERLRKEGEITNDNIFRGKWLTDPGTGAKRWKSPGFDTFEFRFSKNGLSSELGDQTALAVARKIAAGIPLGKPSDQIADSVAPSVVDNPQRTASDAILKALNGGQSISWQDLFAMADKAWNGTQSNGAYTVKDAYDALELAVNRWLESKQAELSPNASLDAVEIMLRRIERDVLARIPTQTKRTAETDAMQQFSTPPHFALVANWAARVTGNDIMLEPSAGIGGIAVFAKNAGATVIANELSPRRREFLKEMGFPHVFGENAEHLFAILEPKIQAGEIPRPTVVVMNPPFSNAAKSGEKGNTMIGAQHIEQALKLLPEGGRLVAIVGEGMGMTAPTFRGWWNRMRGDNTIRANILVDGKNYAKYGTTFSNRLLVIDKGGSTTDANPVLTAEVATIDELPKLLEGIRNDRLTLTSAGESRPGAAEAPKADTRPADQSAVPTTESVAGNESAGSDRPAGSGTERRPPQRRPSGSTGRTGGVSDAAGTAERNPAGSGRADSGSAAAGKSTGVDAVELGRQESAPAPLESEDDIFARYRPAKIKIAGSQPHPAPLVETAAMASVEAPNPTYQPRIPKEAIAKGMPSDVQLEAIVYAGQAHEQLLPNGERRGFFIGDGTGVGKGIEIASIFLDNWNQGRKKGVWISKTPKLVKAAKRDAGDVGINPSLIVPLNKVKTGEDITATEGIYFAGYGTLAKGHNGVDQDGKIIAATGGKKSRLQQLVDWLGPDFDGVIAFDEAHKAGNAIGVRSGRGMTKPSAAGVAVVDIQKLLPKARIVYVSATGATELTNLSYADRLGLWGPGTSFSTKLEFFGKLAEAGLSGMEIVARDMKALGSYMARSISYKGVGFRRLTHALTPEQRTIYDKMAGAWNLVFQNVQSVLDSTGAGNNKNARSAASSAFWGAQQRFFNQFLIALQIPSLISDMEATLAADKSAVLQLVNTSEAQQGRAVAAKLSEAEDGEDVNFEDLNVTPREILLQYVDVAFPINKFEEVQDPNNPERTVWVPATDSAGKPLIDPEAVKRKNDLLAELSLLAVPDAAMNQIIDHFGYENVAEVTGRSERLVWTTVKGQRERVLQKRAATSAEVEAQEFQDGKRRILIFSDAGGTGFSFHADNRAKNQQQRMHYVVQPGWKAAEAMQGLGRSHRSNQATSPEFVLVETDIKGHRRFISTIARRLAQLGALTTGERAATGQGLFNESDNLESDYANNALAGLMRSIYNNQVPGWTINSFGEALGFAYERTSQRSGEKEFYNKLVDSTGGLNVGNLPTIPQFLNRLLGMSLSQQSDLFDLFDQKLKDTIENAKAAGVYDPGTQSFETTKPDLVSLRQTEDKLVYEHPTSTAKTRLVGVDVETRTHVWNWNDISRFFDTAESPVLGYAQNIRSGKVYALKEGPESTSAETGDVTQTYRLRGVTGASVRPKKEVNRERYTVLTKQEAEKLWNEQAAAAPKTVTEPAHFLVGALVPIWDRLRLSRVQVFRFTPEGHNSQLGVLVPEDEVDGLLIRLGAGATMTPEKAFASVLSDAAKLKLANGWTVDRVRVSGDRRIEVKGLTYENRQEFLSHIGGSEERINWDTRYFLPTDPTKGVEAMRKLLAKSPVAEFNGDPLSGGGSQTLQSAPLVTHEFADGARLTGEGLHTLQSSPLVYHGTPHDFDRFDLSKIGTGEGAQVYGWGLYFAELKMVAQNYARMLANGTTLKLDGKPINELGLGRLASEVFDGIALHTRMGDSLDEAIRLARQSFSLRDQVELFDAVVLQTRDRLSAESEGNVFTAELLPDEEDFLDWDKPLSEQSEKVQAILTADKIARAQKNMVGQQIYARLASNHGDAFGLDPNGIHAGASKYLASIGIPGIKYLDQGSRGQSGEKLQWRSDVPSSQWRPDPLEAADSALRRCGGDVGKAVAMLRAEHRKTGNPYQLAAADGLESGRIERVKGTRNYVLFDDKLVRILEKNGKPVDAGTPQRTQSSPLVDRSQTDGRTRGMTGAEGTAQSGASPQGGLSEAEARVFSAAEAERSRLAAEGEAKADKERARIEAQIDVSDEDDTLTVHLQPGRFDPFSPAGYSFYRDGDRLSMTDPEGRDSTFRGTEKEAIAFAKKELLQRANADGDQGAVLERIERTVLDNLPDGWTLEEVQGALTGSGYFYFSDGEETYKIRIGNHGSSVFRQKEFGANDYEISIPKEPTVSDWAEAYGKMHRWLLQKAAGPLSESAGPVNENSPAPSSGARLQSAPLAATVTEAEGAEKTVAAWRLPFRAVGVGEDKLNRGAVEVARAAGRMIDKGASLTGVKSLVSKMAGSAAGDAVGAAWAEVRRQIAPMSVLQREVAAKLLNTKAAMTWSKVRAGELHKLLKIGSEGGLAEMTEGFHVPKEANTAANHRLLSQYFRGKVPIDEVPESLRPLAKSVTDQWTERGRQMVEAGIMSQRTFDERRANYFPHMFYSKEADEQGGVGWLRSRLKMGLDRVKPQLSTAYYIYQIDETGAPKLDRFGVPRLLEHEPGRWRFTSAQHRNAFFERFVRAQTVEAVRKTGRRSFTEHDLERITLADKDTQATVRALMQKVRAGYQMGKPTDEETLAKMGLIENLAYVVPKSLIQMDHDIALANLFTDLATDSRLVSDVKLGETWKQLPTDPRWGSLSGKWIDRDLHAQLIEFHAAPSLAAQIYDAALNKWKKLKTVYNPATHVRNVVGNLFFADLAGVSVQNPDNWHYYYEAIQAMRGNHAWLKTEEMVQHGIIGSDFSMAELKAAFDEIVLPKPEEMERTEPTQALFLRNPGRWFLGKLKSGAKGMETAYRAEDQIFKVAAYLKQRGAGVMPKEAAAHISKWFPTYSNIGASTLTRFMRRFTSPFLSFMMEAWRIGGVALAEQPVTLAKWLAIPTMLTTLSALALGLSDDDLEAIRKDMRGQVFGMPWFSVLLPWTDDLGRPMQFDLTNVIPYADALGKRNDTDGDDSLMQSVIKKYFLSGPALQLAMAWGFGKNPYTDKSFAQPDMTAGEVLREKLAYTGKLLAPPLTPGIGTADPFAWFTGPEKTGRFLRPRSRGAEVARQLGGIDVRSAEPDPYRMAEEFRKKQGLPQPVGSTDTTLKSRTRADAYKAVVNGDVDGLAAALTKLRDATGTDIRTAQDLEQLFYFRRPLAMIGGDPATKRSAKEMQRLFLGGLSPLENTTVTAAEQRWKEARSKAPLILRQARDKMPPRPPRKPVASAKPRGDATKFFDLTAV